MYVYSNSELTLFSLTFAKLAAQMPAQTHPNHSVHIFQDCRGRNTIVYLLFMNDDTLVSSFKKMINTSHQLINNTRSDYITPILQYHIVGLTDTEIWRLYSTVIDICNKYIRKYWIELIFIWYIKYTNTEHNNNECELN